MNPLEAFHALKNGHRIRRIDWNDSQFWEQDDGYIFVRNDLGELVSNDDIGREIISNNDLWESVSNGSKPSVYWKNIRDDFKFIFKTKHELLASPQKPELRSLPNGAKFWHCTNHTRIDTVLSESEYSMGTCQWEHSLVARP